MIARESVSDSPNNRFLIARYARFPIARHFDHPVSDSPNVDYRADRAHQSGRIVHIAGLTCRADLDMRNNRPCGAPSYRLFFVPVSDSPIVEGLLVSDRPMLQEARRAQALGKIHRMIELAPILIGGFELAGIVAPVDPCGACLIAGKADG